MVVCFFVLCSEMGWSGAGAGADAEIGRKN